VIPRDLPSDELPGNTSKRFMAAFLKPFFSHVIVWFAEPEADTFDFIYFNINSESRTIGDCDIIREQSR